MSPTLSSHRGPALEALISALSRTQPCTNRPGTVRPWAVPLAPLSMPVLPGQPAVLGDSPDLSLCAVHSPRVHSVCFAASALCAFSGTLLALLTLRSCDALLLWGHSQVLPLFSLCLLENYVTILGSFFFIQDAILIPVYCATVHTKKK